MSILKKEDAIRVIKKLHEVEISESATPQERDNARRRIGELMVKYELSARSLLSQEEREASDIEDVLGRLIQMAKSGTLKVPTVRRLTRILVRSILK